MNRNIPDDPLGGMGRMALLFSMVGIVILYGAANYSQPHEVHLDELEEHEGDRVKVTATVTGVRELQGGATLLTLTENNVSAPLFIERSARHYREGDVIEVRGKVACYEGTYELSVLNDRSVVILDEWDSEVSSLKELFGNCRECAGTNIRVFGIAAHVTDNGGESIGLTITDLEALCYLEVTASRVYLDPGLSIEEGAPLEICGFFSLCSDFTYRLSVKEEHHYIRASPG